MSGTGRRGKRGCGGEWATDFIGWRAGWSSLELSFPLCGNGLNQPLDSSLRRNDDFVWTPAFIRLGQANRVIRALRPHKKGVFPDCVEGRLEQAALGQGDRFFIPDHDVIQHPDIDQPEHLF